MNMEEMIKILETEYAYCDNVSDQLRAIMKELAILLKLYKEFVVVDSGEPGINP